MRRTIFGSEGPKVSDPDTIGECACCHRKKRPVFEIGTYQGYGEGPPIILCIKCAAKAASHITDLLLSREREMPDE